MTILVKPRLKFKTLFKKNNFELSKDLIYTRNGSSAIGLILNYYKKISSSKLIVLTTNITCLNVIQTCYGICNETILINEDEILEKIKLFDNECQIILIINNVLSIKKIGKTIRSIPKEIPIIIDRAHSIPNKEVQFIDTRERIYYIYSLSKVSEMFSGGLIITRTNELEDIKKENILKNNSFLEELEYTLRNFIKLLILKLIPKRISKVIKSLKKN